MTDAKPPSMPRDTYESLVDATVVALVKHGYGDLTVRDIDAEWEKSRQLINYYFDGKDELLSAVLVDVIERAEGNLPDRSADDPLTELHEALDAMLLEPDEELYFWEFLTAVYEMQSQAHRNPEYRERFNQIAENSVEHLAEIIQRGIDEGAFVDVDAHQTAKVIDDIVTGAHTKKIYLGQDDAPPNAREALDQFIVSRLLDANGVGERGDSGPDA